MNAIARYAQPSADFADKLALLPTRLRQAAQDHPRDAASGEPRLSLACSLGAEDLLLAHWIDRLDLAADVFVLDTGCLHPESLQTLVQLTQHSRAKVRVFRPDPGAAEAFVAEHGSQAMYASVALRKACCGVRKMAPLARALAGRSAWITGLRREQSDSRADVPLIDQDAIGGITRCKYNPLADWTWGDVWSAIDRLGVAYNPLHDRFYPSIGCAPCTRAISLGEAFRAGRWWWEDESAKECGLHVKPAPSSALPAA